ncbi:MAG: exodeoxyribonuclease VII large subunit [Gammaproteobacteria bacterium]|nr:exodeoxyribonuclease VII large subunit [Gammaproteobacteria bacterium]
MQPRPGEPVYTVSQVTREARDLLEQAFPALWVSGEVSNLARPASGHVYFSLKDAQAQLRCAMFRGSSRLLRFRPENGQQVLVRARISLYEARGDFQLIVEHMEPAGDGLLLRRLEELKKRLAAEGLFDAARKRALPLLPGRIGVVTSPTGAALRDVLHVLRRRFPAIPVVVYPTPVQGEAAPAGIVAALTAAAERRECDVLIVARGGGSLEDLWSFNEEAVARAIAASPIPVVSGVGHETDFTLADFAADVRAPTPSGAAELAAPDWREWLRRVGQLERTASAGVGRRLERLALRMATLERRLARTHPGYVLRQHAQRLDELGARLLAGMHRSIALRRLREKHVIARLRLATPEALLAKRAGELERRHERLTAAIHRLLAAGERRLALAAAKLDAFSPLQTLQRGYALVTVGHSGALLRQAGDVRAGDEITARLASGEIDAVVTRVR